MLISYRLQESWATKVAFIRVPGTGLADLEGDLAGKHVGHLVAVVVQVIGRLDASRRNFLDVRAQGEAT
jgi:hypothetical protein